MLEKGCYDTWQSHILLYFEGKEHGEMLLDSIFLRPFEFKDITILANEAIVDEFDRFTSGKGEMIQSYYMRFAKLMKDINIIRLDMTRLHVNTKFVNHLQPEWSKYVTGVKQARNLHEVSFDQLYAYLK
ncbi:hypothetical protein Tco_1087681 [Tanacetum coccineum]